MTSKHSTRQPMCEKAGSLDIKFKCPYSPQDCSVCPLFGSPTNKPECFVKIPTAENDTAFESMTKEQNITLRDLIIWGHDYTETGNLAYAMRAFVRAIDEGLYPPMWALNAIGGVFRSFLKLTTKRSIADFFGCGPGRNLVKEMANNDERKAIRLRIEKNYFEEGGPLFPNYKGLGAVANVENEDDKNPEQYEHIAKTGLTPALRLNRAVSKALNKKRKKHRKEQL